MVPSGSAVYEYGSTAPKIKYDEYQDNTFLKNKRKKISYRKIKTKMFLLTLMVFACGMMIMYRYAMITDMNYQIDAARSKYNRMENDNIFVRMKIQNELDLSKLREVAENRLGMHEPRGDQMVMVNVPREDYIETLGEKHQHTKGFMLATLDHLARFLGII
jgi:cell division protein FtsL